MDRKLKTLIIVMTVFLLFSSAFAEDMVTIPRETLLKIRDYVVELQAAYNALVDELNVKDVALASAYQELSRLRKRSSGLWLGATAGIPFPTAGVQGMYIFNNNIGVMINGGYSTEPYVQAGVTIRVGK